MKNLRPGVRLAFTLIELLVVIAILGILTAFLIPAVHRGKSRAQQIQCVSNLHQLGVGLHQFLANNHGYPSMFATTNDDYPGSWIAQLVQEGLGVSKFDKNYLTTGIWRCPSAQWSSRVPANLISMSYTYNVYGCAMPGYKTNSLGLFGHYSEGPHTFRRILELEVVTPSEMMAIGDGFTGGAFFMRYKLASLANYGNTLTRHQGKANVVFCDGHVESPTLKFLFEDTSDAALVRWNRDHQPHRERLAP